MADRKNRLGILVVEDGVTETAITHDRSASHVKGKILAEYPLGEHETNYEQCIRDLFAQIAERVIKGESDFRYTIRYRRE